ncbi:MAG: hypothetical protein ABIQ66_07520 [Novosphingobium sp.]
MLDKVAGLARAIALILAVVAAFVALPANVPLVLLLLGVIAGFIYTADDITWLGVMVLILPMIGAALGNVPQIGGQLGAVMGNVALAIAGILATRVILRLYDLLVGDIKGLAK